MLCRKVGCAAGWEIAALDCLNAVLLAARVLAAGRSAMRRSETYNANAEIAGDGLTYRK